MVPLPVLKGKSRERQAGAEEQMDGKEGSKKKKLQAGPKSAPGASGTSVFAEGLRLHYGHESQHWEHLGLAYWQKGYVLPYYYREMWIQQAQT